MAKRLLWMAFVALLGLAVFAPAAAQDDLAEPVPLADENGYDILNFLLLGADTDRSTNIGRTDAIMIVSVNRSAGTVGFLSIPRDVWVYIPEDGPQRINTAFSFGERSGYDGGGPQLLADTVEHNFGIHIDHYARVDFNGFKDLVDNVGGVDISVDCAIEDWRLSAPDLDPTLEDSWAMFTLPVGVHRMEGDLALWYVRSRRTSTDLDRGRRQQAMVRALWQRVRALGLFDQLSDIWPQVMETVLTDVDAAEMVDLVPLALTLDSSRIASYIFRPNIEIVPWTTPDGASVLLPEPDAIAETVRHLYEPPTDNQIVREAASIEITNASGYGDLSQVAADRLALEGFVPRINPDPLPVQEFTLLYDYTGQAKGGSLGALRSILRLSDEAVISEPDPNRSADFRVVIGKNYRSCTYGVLPPNPPTTTD